MSKVFVIIFLAALVGIAKPWLKGTTRKQFAIGAFIAFIAVAVSAPKQDAASPVVASKNSAPNTAATNTASPSPTPSPSNWSYNDEKDDMRGTSTHTATVRADNTVDFGFPYGESGAEIWIRRGKKLDVAFAVDKGQVLCNSFTDTHISMKFGNGPVEKFECTGASDGSSETAFIVNSSRALEKLRHAQKVIVEAEFFQHGRQQFTFQTDGLVWP